MSNSIPSVILFFGIAGAGKSFAGRALAEGLGYHHYELDQDLTPAMRVAIAENRPFTEEMRDEFFEVVVQRIRDVLREHPRTVFTQGVYKERHRKFLRERVPGLESIWVTAPSPSILSRLLRRGDSVSAEYAALIERNFEPPQDGLILPNDDCSPADCCARFLALFRQ